MIPTKPFRWRHSLSPMIACLMLIFLSFSSQLFSQVDCGFCTNPDACNYNPAADPAMDDGSCFFGECEFFAADDCVFTTPGAMIDYNVLCNDGFALESFVFPQSDNPCFGITLQGSVFVNPDTQEDCCGTHEIPYCVQTPQGEFCATLTIKVECPKPDCEFVDLSEYVGDIVNPGGDGTVQGGNCISVCENSETVLQFPFDASLSYDWNVFGGTHVVNPMNPAEITVIWGATGSGNVTLTTSTLGGIDTFHDFCVDILPGPLADFTSNGYVCNDSPLCFDNLSIDADSYHWDFGDGNYSTLAEPCHTYDTPGTYTVTLTAFRANFDRDGNPLCCCTDVITMDVEVDPLPGPQIYWVSTLCEGDNSDYWTDATGCGTYEWTVLDANDDPVPFTGQGTPNINVTWGAGPVGTVMLEVADCDDDYCTEPSEVTVPIIPSIGQVDGPTDLCAFSTATYTLPKWVNSSYDWEVTGGTIISGNGTNSIVVQWGPAGVGTIHVDFGSEFLNGLPNHSGDDCYGTADLNVNLTPEFSIIHNGTNPVCAGSLTSASAFSPLGATDCIWNFTPSVPFTGDGTSFINIDWSVPAGTYIVEATPVNPLDYCNETATFVIQVQDLATPSISGPIEICPNTSEFYEVVSPEPGLTYTWSAVGGTLPFATGTNVQVDWDGSGTYSVTVTAQSNSVPFCSSDPATLTVTPLGVNDPIVITTGPACSNTIGSYGMTPMQEDEAIITWGVTPAIAGSVLVQNDENTQIQWNDWDGMATLSVTVEICDEVVTESVTINVTQAIVPVISQTGILCPGVTATLETTMPFASYDWSPTGDTTPTTDITAEGNYTVTTIDANGCEATSNFEANAVPGPVASISPTAPLTICIGNPHTVTLVAQFNADYSYQWYCGGSLVPGATNPNFDHPFQGIEGSYSYWVVVTDDTTGCMETSNTIVVNEVEDCSGGEPCQLANPYTWDVSGTLQTPDCNQVGFVSTQTGASFVQWTFGDGNISGVNPVIHTYTEAACYNVGARIHVPRQGGGVCVIDTVFNVCVPVAADFDFAALSCTEFQFTEGATFLATDPANTINSYSWDFNGYGSSSLEDPTFDFPVPGTHPVTLTVTTVGGCMASFTRNVFVDSVGIPAITINPGPTCVGDPIGMNASAIGATSYEWDFGDGSSFVGAMTNKTYTAAGTYTITVDAYNDAGCVNSSTTTITIFPGIPELSILEGPDVIVCEGELATLTAPAGYTYLWSTSDNTQSITVGPGTYSVILRDANDCQRELDPVTVTEVDEPDATISGNPFICDNGCTTLSVPFSSDNTYEWKDGNGDPVGTGSSITICWPIVNNPYTVNVVNQYGCQAMSSIDITLSNSPAVSVIVSPDGCEGTLNTLSVSPVLPGVSYTWSTGDTGPSITTSTVGAYTVVAVDDVSGCSNSATGIINPLPNLCAVPVGCYTSCDPDTICAPGGLAAYQWNLNGSPIPGAVDTCLIVTDPGNYTLTATNDFGCTTTSLDLILELIDCDDDPCEDVSIDYNLLITNNTPNQCCFDLTLNNGYDQTQGVSIYTSDADIDFDIASIDPLLMLQGSTSNSVDLVHIDTSNPLPVGTINDAIEICVNNVVNDPQTIYVDWYDMESMVVCRDSIILHCPVEPDCLYLQSDSIYCENGETIYDFTICNPYDAEFDVAYFTLNNLTPAGIVATPAVFNPSPAIAAGECRSFSTTLSGTDIGGETFCFQLVAHEADPNIFTDAACCSLDTLYCIEIPECDPCRNVGVLETADTDPEDCCMEITLFNNYDPAFFDELMICAVDAGTTVTVNNTIGSGWITSGYTGTSFSLLPDAVFGGFVPGGNFTLPEICVQSSVAPPTILEIKWMKDGEVLCSDLVENFCDPDCGYHSEDVVECGNEEWIWTGFVTNTSGFDVSELHIHFTDPALAAYNQVISTGLLLDGQTFGPFSINIGAPASAGDVVCWTATLHEVGPNGELLSCCNFQHCVELPDCGFQEECLCDEDFVEAVADGIIITPLGGYQYGYTLANFGAFGECDQVQWYLGSPDDVIITAPNVSVTNTFPGPGTYWICVKVFRTDVNGVQCEEKYCYQLTVPAIADDNLPDASIFPNPNNGEFDIVMKNQVEGDVQMEIYDNAHRMVQSETIYAMKNGTSYRVQLNELGTGLYFVHLNIQGERVIRKVIVR